MKMVNVLKIKKFFVFYHCIFILAILQSNSWAYIPPVGIPDPSWTTHPIDTVTPSQPNGWPSIEVSGYYYIDNTHINATDTANVYGYPNRPRLSIPTNVAPGAKIFVRRCSSLTKISGVSGTPQNPNWIIGIDEGVIQPEKVGIYLNLAESDYWFIDGITFDGTNTPNVAASVAIRIDGGTDYVVIRNSIVKNMVVADFSAVKGTAAWTSGLTAILPSINYPNNISNIVFYNLNISNNAGGQFLDYESGRHAVITAGYIVDNVTFGVDSLWILDSTFHNNPEDGIQVGLSALGSDQSKCRRIYIGRNKISNNGENAIDLKASSDIIISENQFSGSLSTVYRIGATSGSDGSAGVINDNGGGPLNDWWIFNTFSNSRCGIRNQAAGGNHYIIGNLFYDINKKDGEAEPASTGSNAGVAYWQSAGSVSSHIINNTIHDVHGGIYINNSKEIHVKGNIVSDIVDRSLGFPININNAPIRTLISNLYYDKDGTVRKDADAIGGTDRIDINPLLKNENSRDYHPLINSPALNSMVTPSEYALFEDIFSRNIFFDKDLRSRPLAELITVGALEYVHPTPIIDKIMPIL